MKEGICSCGKEIAQWYNVKLCNACLKEANQQSKTIGLAIKTCMDNTGCHPVSRDDCEKCGKYREYLSDK